MHLSKLSEKEPEKNSYSDKTEKQLKKSNKTQTNPLNGSYKAIRNGNRVELPTAEQKPSTD